MGMELDVCVSVGGRQGWEGGGREQIIQRKKWENSVVPLCDKLWETGRCILTPSLI